MITLAGGFCLVIRYKMWLTFYKQFLRQYSFAKKLQSQTVIKEKRCKELLYEKGACTLKCW